MIDHQYTFEGILDAAQATDSLPDIDAVGMMLDVHPGREYGALADDMTGRGMTDADLRAQAEGMLEREVEAVDAATWLRMHPAFPRVAWRPKMWDRG